MAALGAPPKTPFITLPDGLSSRVFEVSLTKSRRAIGMETRQTKGGAASPASSSRPFVLVPEVWGGQMA